jgi:hypothetical protein
MDTSTPEPAPFPGEYAAALEAAHDEWQRRAHLSPLDQLMLTVDEVWTRGYTLGYRQAAARVAEQVRDVAAGAADNLAPHCAEPDRVRRCLAQLGQAASFMTQPLAPPTPAATVTAAATAAVAVDDPVTAATNVVWPHALRAGGVAGIVTAAGDILTNWRTRVGTTELDRVRIGTQPITQWANGLLAGVNRDAARAAAWTTTSHADWIGRLRARDAAAAGSGPTTTAAAGTHRAAGSGPGARAAQGFPRMGAVVKPGTGAAAPNPVDGAAAAVRGHGRGR